MSLLHATLHSPSRIPWIASDGLGTRYRISRSHYRASVERFSTPENEDEVEQVLEETKNLMKEIQNQTIVKKSHIPTTQDFALSTKKTERPAVTLHCDVSGCTIAPVDDAAQMESSLEEIEDISDAFVLRGKGWKLGVNEEAKKAAFPAFIGADDWLIALTNEEYNDFVTLLKNLRQGVATLEVCGDWGTEDSEATLEMCTSRIWMQGRASQKRLTLLNRLWSRKSFDEADSPTVAFSLRFIVRSKGTRTSEGCWTEDAVMECLKALEKGSEPILKKSKTPS